ncbi:uncharacterized protein L199_006792 [Kwoniella botswanensis]|uniref:uncharacterized protein n=1 Tax=Kwoniella botswanensis TaxID=1268659 RepID=UPI00315D0AB9
MLSLPEEPLEAFLTRLDFLSIIACSSTCKKLNQIVTTSIPVQLKLHRALYQDHTRSSEKLQELKDPALAVDQLSNLIKRHEAFEEFEPSLTTYDLGAGQEIVSAYGGYIATVPCEGHEDPEIDENGYTNILTLIKIPASKASAIEKTKKKVILEGQVSSVIVDISKNLVIVRQFSEDDMRVRAHIYRLYSSNVIEPDQLEYQGAGTIDLGQFFPGDEDEVEHVPWRIAVGPKDMFLVEGDVDVRVYSWMDGRLMCESELNRREYRYEKRQGISIVFPPGKLKALVQDVLKGKVTSTNRSKEWTKSTLRFPPETAVIEPKHWWRCSFWGFEDSLTAKNDSCSFGSKVVSYRNSMDYQGSHDHRYVQLLDLNPKILSVHPPLGTALGGMGRKMDLVIKNISNQYQRDTKTLKREITFGSSTRTIVPSSGETLGAVCYQLKYAYRDNRVASIHYEGEMIIVEYENSEVDVWRIE